jgi:toxin ParE1/3/4
VAEVFQKPASRRDLIENYVYLAEYAGAAVADRFLERAQVSFSQILEQPLMGSPVVSRRPELAGLRKWRVSDFEDVLIFYLPHDRGISIVRVLRGTRDWWHLLGLV